jgi:hypothetical protein
MKRSPISQAIERQSVVPVESTIPPDTTIAEWRRQRTRGNVVPLRPTPCDHLHDSTTRYDHATKQLTFLLVCPVCGTEKIVETQRYEPRFVPSASDELPRAA